MDERKVHEALGVLWREGKITLSERRRIRNVMRVHGTDVAMRYIEDLDATAAEAGPSEISGGEKSSSPRLQKQSPGRD